MDARETAYKIIADIEERGRYAQLALGPALDDAGIEGRDRALTTELVYGVIRRQLALDWLIGRFSNRPAKKVDSPIRTILRLGIYQIVYLDKIPDHAAVDSAVRIAKKRARPGAEKFVNAVLRNTVRQKDKLPWPDRSEDEARYLSVFHSHPRWLVDLWTEAYGTEETEAMLAADNHRPVVTLRVNRLRAAREALLERLNQDGSVAEPGVLFSEAIRLKGEKVPESVMREGLAYVQDEASMAVGHAVAPRPGDHVIDVCAGPGGKTTHLAELMDDRGRIWAVDKSSSRLGLVRENVRRLRIEAVEFIEADFTQTQSLPEVDRVLVDAPCSGLGVLSRRPDLRWRRSPKEITDLAQLQKKIMIRAGDHVKPGGRLVYSVCTMTAQETTEVVGEFLSTRPEFEPVALELPVESADSPFMQFMPHIHGTDGMFIAAFRRKRPPG